MATKYTVHNLITDLRSGKFTSVGCYPTFFLTSDGETLSHEAVRENIWQVARDTRDGSRSGWAIIGFDANWEDPAMFCAHTGERIESAYAEDDAVSTPIDDPETTPVPAQSMASLVFGKDA